MVKNLPKMQETRVGSLGWEDPLQKETASHSKYSTHSVHGESHGQWSMVGYSPWGSKEAHIFLKR